MKYFGTDGIRLNDTHQLIKIAKALSKGLAYLGAKKIVIGRDTRLTGKKIYKAFKKELISNGIFLLNYNVVPTASIAFFTINAEADYGIVITASHSLSDVNGIKIFNAQGEKLSKKEEKKLEKFIDNPPKNDVKAKAKVKNLKSTAYINFLKNNSIDLKDRKIVIDCANGATKKIAPKLFTTLGAKVVKICCGKGNNINSNCGAVHPQELSKTVLKTKSEIGFAFDGDGDRCVCVLSSGKILSGDNILLAVAKHNKLNSVVGTIYANGGLDDELKNNGIKFLRSDVGDSNVAKMMKENNVFFGGECSGHFIFSNLLPTGDGLLTALEILKIKNFEEISKFEKKPSVVINLTTQNKESDLAKLQDIKVKSEKELNGEGRLILRASGTEPLIRILVEHTQIDVAQKIADSIKNQL